MSYLEKLVKLVTFYGGCAYCVTNRANYLVVDEWHKKIMILRTRANVVVRHESRTPIFAIIATWSADRWK
jgi:hypothetical protein